MEGGVGVRWGQGWGEVGSGLGLVYARGGPHKNMDTNNMEIQNMI